MSQLSEKDKMVVKRWWKCSVKTIYQSGYTLGSKYSPSLTPSHLPETCRSFQEIANAGIVIVRCRCSLSQFFLSVAAVSDGQTDSRQEACEAHDSDGPEECGS
jgi:hypothetical protein